MIPIPLVKARDKSTSDCDRQVMVAILMAITALAGCSKEKAASRYECTCPFLTDFDDASSQRVDVCAETIEKAGEVARGCAQSAAPAPVDVCTCERVAGTCRPGDCDIKAMR